MIAMTPVSLPFISWIKAMQAPAFLNADASCLEFPGKDLYFCFQSGVVAALPPDVNQVIIPAFSRHDPNTFGGRSLIPWVGTKPGD